jgi:phosphatidylglycerophosphate synthase
MQPSDPGDRAPSGEDAVKHGRDGGRARPRPSAAHVLFNVPNSICWLRLLLLGAAAWAWQQQQQQPAAAFWLLACNLLLDSVDGVLARRLQQETAVGAVFDVLVDNLTRGWMWATALPPGWAVLPVFWEMLVFAVTHKVSPGHIRCRLRVAVCLAAAARQAAVRVACSMQMLGSQLRTHAAAARSWWYTDTPHAAVHFLLSRSSRAAAASAHHCPRCMPCRWLELTGSTNSWRLRPPG